MEIWLNNCKSKYPVLESRKLKRKEQLLMTYIHRNLNSCMVDNVEKSRSWKQGIRTFSAPVASSITQFSRKHTHIASRSSAFSKRSDCFCTSEPVAYQEELRIKYVTKWIDILIRNHNYTNQAHHVLIVILIFKSATTNKLVLQLVQGQNFKACI